MCIIFGLVKFISINGQKWIKVLFNMCNMLYSAYDNKNIWLNVEFPSKVPRKLTNDLFEVTTRYNL